MLILIITKTPEYPESVEPYKNTFTGAHGAVVDKTEGRPYIYAFSNGTSKHREICFPKDYYLQP
jgi:hypothetical protein